MSHPRTAFRGALVIILLASLTAPVRSSVSATNSPEPPFSKTWKLAELPAQPGWGAYGGGDTWPGVLGIGDYRIAVAPPLPAGRYRVQVRTLNVPKLSLSLGGDRPGE